MFKSLKIIIILISIFTISNNFALKPKFYFKVNFTNELSKKPDFFLNIYNKKYKDKNKMYKEKIKEIVEHLDIKDSDITPQIAKIIDHKDLDDLEEYLETNEVNWQLIDEMLKRKFRDNPETLKRLPEIQKDLKDLNSDLQKSKIDQNYLKLMDPIDGVITIENVLHSGIYATHFSLNDLYDIEINDIPIKPGYLYTVSNVTGNCPPNTITRKPMPGQSGQTLCITETSYH